MHHLTHLIHPIFTIVLCHTLWCQLAHCDPPTTEKTTEAGTEGGTKNAASVASEATAHSAPYPATAPRATPPGPTRIIPLTKAYKNALIILSKEPALQQLLTLAIARYAPNAKRIARWKHAARASALLPTVRITTDMDFERDESLDRYQDEPDRWGADTDRDFEFQLTIQWEFSHLVYHPEELKIHRTYRDHQEKIEEVQNYLINIYHKRRNLILLQAMHPTQDATTFLARQTEIEIYTSQIASLTECDDLRKLESMSPSKK